MSDRQPPPEEPWEAQIHELLASLPPVDPPPGFIQRAIDHRPKYAIRASAAALASVAVAAIAIAGLGSMGEHPSVAPPVGALGQRHIQVAAGLGPDRGGAQAATFEPVPDEAEVVQLPPAYEPRAVLEDGEVLHLVYQHAGRSVSVFAQRGSLDWDELPEDGRARVGGRPVWRDPARRIVVAEVGAFVVAVVGLDVDEALALLRHEPAHGPGTADRLRALAREVARHAGFP